MYTEESIETLRQRIDLVDVLSSHLDLKRAGSSFKALCPFHEEKTPSFMMQRGDDHYHCFGCGAHGDAIAFLMGHLKMSFVDAIEHLAERFQVVLEKTDLPQEKKGPSKTSLKHALELAAQLYHYLLLHSAEGHEALQYLYKRAIALDFIKRFRLGYAPREGAILYRYLRTQQVEEAVIEQAGLIPSGKKRDFFSQRILFPIRDAFGAVIGFSGRKLKEETFGGKYINTPETLLFKKSRVLFGLSESRAKIAKERKAIIVEGQIDALRLIYSGFDYTVAGQGTAFGAEHVKELIHLGVSKVYLALDGDEAGREAAAKIGHLFSREGVEVFIVSLPQGSDPDSLLLAKGPEWFALLVEKAQDYLTFLFTHLSKGEKELSPSRKNEIVTQIAERIRSWEQPVLIHESLKKLTEIAHIPENTLRIEGSDPFIRYSGNVSIERVNPDRILETDLLRWLFLVGVQNERLLALTRANIQGSHFRLTSARRLFEAFFQAREEKRPCDILSLGSSMGQEEQQLLSAILERKINLNRAEEGCRETIRKILMRSWTEEKEKIRVKIQSALLSDEEALELAKEFDALKNRIPQVKDGEG